MGEADQVGRGSISYQSQTKVTVRNKKRTEITSLMDERRGEWAMGRKQSCYQEKEVDLNP